MPPPLILKAPWWAVKRVIRKGGRSPRHLLSPGSGGTFSPRKRRVTLRQAPSRSGRAGDLMSPSAHPGLGKHLRECFLNNV